jgi:hypothetical protein
MSGAAERLIEADAIASDARADSAEPANAAQPTEANRLHQYLHMVLDCTVRGALSMVVGRASGPDILVAMCRSFGSVMGRIYGGDDIEVQRFRRACRDAFKEAIKAEAVIKPTAPNG